MPTIDKGLDVLCFLPPRIACTLHRAVRADVSVWRCPVEDNKHFLEESDHEVSRLTNPLVRGLTMNEKVQYLSENFKLSQDRNRRRSIYVLSKTLIKQKIKESINSRYFNFLIIRYPNETFNFVLKLRWNYQSPHVSKNTVNN